MALFGTPKATKAKASKAKSPKNAAPARKARDIKDAEGKLSGILLRPWLSEKALIGTERRVYAFEIPARATKADVKLAIEKDYKVVPVKIATVNLPAKKKPLRGGRRGFGMNSIRRKAYVYLREGDTIQFA